MTHSPENQETSAEALKRALFALKDMRQRLDAAEAAKTEPIAVIGMACRIPGGANDPEAYWELLKNGVDAVADIPAERWDVKAFYDPDPNTPGKTASRQAGMLRDIDQFDPQFFGISPREALSIDPQQRLLLETSWEALENAGYSPVELAGSQTGVFVGISGFDYMQLNMNMSTVDQLDSYVGTGGMFSVSAGRIAYALGLHGPTVALDTACSSSLVSIHMACESLRAGKSELALAGGVNIVISPMGNIYLTQMKALSPDDRCKTFDDDANGFVRGEGCGMVVLKRLSDAIADRDNILAVVRGSAINHDGRSSGLTVPNGQAQQAVIRQALADAGDLQPNDINYVETHGTGTPLGDPIEVRALAAALCQDRPKDNPLTLGSVKTNIGHLESAAGVAAFIKVILALQNEEIPPHLHLKKPNQHIDWENLPIQLPTQAIPWKRGAAPRRAGISAFGFSGTNAHLILEEAPPQPEIIQQTPERPVHVVTLSARSEEALRRQADQYAQFLQTHSAPLTDFAYTANIGRGPFPFRAAITGQNAEQIQESLQMLANGQPDSAIRQGWANPDTQPRTAFLFTGQGAQYPGMGRELYLTQPAFRDALDRCAAILDTELDQTLLRILYPENDADKALIDNTQYTQPALFALEYALAILWQSWGLHPRAVMGHSVGEFVAATLAGVFSLEDGLKLIAARGRLMASLPHNGGMLAVFSDETRLQNLIAPYADSATIAAINGPGQIVISGENESLQAIKRTLQAEGIKSRELVVSHAFHSPLMDPILDEFEQIAQQVTYHPPQLRVISNVTGEVAGPEIATAAYWRQHIRAAVQFTRGMETLQQLQHDIFLEVGPGATLLGMGQQCVTDSALVWLPSLRKTRSDWEQITDTLATLYVHGAKINWGQFDADYARRKIAIPTYPFERERYWSERVTQSMMQTNIIRKQTDTPRQNVNIVHPLLGYRLRSALNTVQFEAEINLSHQPFLDEHRIYGTVIMPATAYLEIGFALAKQLFPQGNPSLENFSIHDALALEDDQTRILQVIATPNHADRSATFEIFSIPAESPEDEWTRHASGLIRAQAAAHPDAPSLDSLRESTAQVFSMEGYYDRFQRIGLHYGPGFQAVRQLWQGDETALGYVEGLLSPDESAQFHLHPALMDAAMHPIGAVRDDATMDKVHLPISLKRFTLYQDAGNALWSYVILHDEIPNESLQADIYLYAADGALVGVVESFFYKHVPRQALQRTGRRNLNNWLYAVDWEPVPLPVDMPTTSERWLILGDTTGQGEALASALTQAGAETRHISLSDFATPPDQSAFAQVLADFPAENVAYLWALDAITEDIPAAQRLTSGYLLALSQALTNAPHSPRLWAVTADAHISNPAQAMTWGLCRVFGNEHSQHWGGIVDLVGTNPPEALAKHLLHSDGEQQARLIDGQRFGARLTAHRPQRTPQNLFSQPFELNVQERGILENLRFAPITRSTPAAGEVEVEVHATGLNFRDVLNVLGMYPGDPGAPGSECTGVVVSLGPDVTGLNIGDRVIALTTGSFRSHVIAPADMIFPIPPSLDMAEAVTIPTTFLTAYYGFYRLAKLKRGDRVLIHAAAGGVGIAAVQLALRTGAEVFGTAGSPEKRDYLKSLGVHHVFNSRTLDFADEIMQVTQGEGVNVVLNSLAGDFIPKSMSVLSDGGCFLEIGKQGVWTDEQVHDFNPTLSYHLYDLGYVMYAEPEIIRDDLNALLRDIDAGELAPLPVETFPIEAAVEAFRHMAQAKHIGKVVITQDHAAHKPIEIQPDASYFLTGGLGGLGLKVTEWLAEQGAKHLVLMGRSAPSESAKATLDSLVAQGVEIYLIQGDVSQAQDVANAIDTISREMPPLRGILHIAGVLDDGFLIQQTAERFERVLRPKVQGAWNLHQYSQHLPLDFFVMFSSVAAVMGSAGQGNYAAGNAFMDALAGYRRQQNLPALSINWGAWAEVGMAANMASDHLERLQAQGMNVIMPDDGLYLLEQFIRDRLNNIAVLPVNWPRMLQNVPHVPAFLSHFAQQSQPEAPQTNGNTPSQTEDSILTRLKNTLPDERPSVLLAFVTEQVVKVLGLSGTNTLSASQGLVEIGMDSLMAVELSNRFRGHFGQNFPSTLAFEHPNIQSLANYLSETVLSQLDDASPAAPADLDATDAEALLSNIDNLTDEQVDALLKQMQKGQE